MKEPHSTPHPDSVLHRPGPVAPSRAEVDSLLAGAKDEARRQLPCPSCGSVADPLMRRPRRLSYEWWDEPDSYVGCALCGQHLASLPAILGVTWGTEAPADRLPDPNGEIASALNGAETHLRAIDASGERRVRERDLADGLAKGMQHAMVERKLSVPGWNPQPGNVDLYTLDQDLRARSVVETKLKASNDIYECLWDMAKLLSLVTLESIEAAFIVAGSPKRLWEKPIECAEMFEDGRHELVGEIKRLHGWWVNYILGDSAGRPLAVAPAVDVTRVATVHPELSGEEWELRAIRIEAVPTDPEDWVPFAEGLPVR